MKNLISVFSLMFLLLGCASTTQYVQQSNIDKKGITLIMKPWPRYTFSDQVRSDRQ